MKITNIVKITAAFLALAAFPAMAQEGGEAINKGLAVIGAGLAGLGAAVGIGILAAACWRQFRASRNWKAN